MVVLLPPSFPGLQLKLKDPDTLLESFTYAVSPLTLPGKLGPVNWKLLVTEDVQSENIRCHELQAEDNLPKLITTFQKAHAVAVVLVNTSENYYLHPMFLSGIQEGCFPVILLTRSDGVTLLKKVEQQKENVFARIVVESFADSNRTLQNPRNAPTHSNSDKTTSEAGQWSMKGTIYHWNRSNPPI